MPITRRRFVQGLLPLLCGTSGAAESAVTPVRVLFIGNSYTYVNDLPKLFMELMKSSKLYAPMVGQVVDGGVHLSHHADSDKTLAVLTHGAADRKPWDVVVLQEQSAMAPAAVVIAEAKSEINDSAQRLASLIWASSPRALIVLYQTWARHPDLWKNGKAPVKELGKDAAEMQKRIHQSIAEVAKGVAERGKAYDGRVLVSPVGDFWQQSLQTTPALRLHAEDGSHPTPAGSMLAATVLMATIGGRAAVEKAAWSGSLSKEDAAAIRKLVLDHPELFSRAVP